MHPEVWIGHCNVAIKNAYLKLAPNYVPKQITNQRTCIMRWHELSFKASEVSEAPADEEIWGFLAVDN